MFALSSNYLKSMKMHKPTDGKMTKVPWNDSPKHGKPKMPFKVRNILFSLSKYPPSRLKVVQVKYTIVFCKQKKQEGHDGPVSLHWLILGNSFKTPKKG